MAGVPLSFSVIYGNGTLGALSGVTNGYGFFEVTFTGGSNDSTILVSDGYQLGVARSYTFSVDDPNDGGDGSGGEGGGGGGSSDPCDCLSCECGEGSSCGHAGCPANGGGQAASCACPAVGHGCTCTAESLCTSETNPNAACPKCRCGGGNCDCTSVNDASSYCQGVPSNRNCQLQIDVCPCGCTKGVSECGQNCTSGNPVCQNQSHAHIELTGIRIRISGPAGAEFASIPLSGPTVQDIAEFIADQAISQIKIVEKLKTVAQLTKAWFLSALQTYSSEGPRWSFDIEIDWKLVNDDSGQIEDSGENLSEEVYGSHIRAGGTGEPNSAVHPNYSIPQMVAEPVLLSDFADDLGAALKRLLQSLKSKEH
jgi:hypothetical protein